MMVTDDTLQDENQVIAAKTLLYKEHLADHIKKVHFVLDGAGCFKSKLHRAVQPFYKTWTDVDEVTLRVTPAGAGKTSLDGRFGTFNSILSKGVDQGASFFSADTVIETAKGAGGMTATEFILFEPDRSIQLSVKMKQSMDSVLLSTCDPDNGYVEVFEHSGYGEGQEIDLLSDCVFSITKNEEKAETIELYNDEDGGMKTEEIEGIEPTCQLKEATRTMKSDLPSFQPRAGEGSGDVRVRAQKSKSRIENRVQKKQLTVQERRQAQTDVGLFICNQCCKHTGRYCTKVFLTENGLDRHTKKVTEKKEGDKEVCTFLTGINARDWLLKKASDPGGLVARGSRVDRSSRICTCAIVASTNSKAAAEARCKGQYNRKDAPKPYTKTHLLKDILEELYNNEVKLNAKEMRKRMREMRDDDGGLLFSHKKRRTNGILLTEGQITSWVSGLTQKQKKAKGPSDTDIQQQELIDGMDTTE